jgi:transcriptional regulator with XRE-family HTH domain
MRLREVFAANLLRLREQRDFSQEELAALARIDRTYVSALEHSRYAASLDVVERLAKQLGVEPADMLRQHAGE